MLALDPSLESSGVVLFRDALLIAAARVYVPAIAGMSHGQRALTMAVRVVDWVIGMQGRVAAVAHEWPNIRPNVRANPNNLIGMAAVDGAVDAALSFIAAQRGEQLELRTFLPEEWTGQLPKDTHKGMYWKSPRGVRIRSRLTDVEWSIAPDQHDAGDAIGIGLFALGRFNVKRALSNGRG